VNQAIWTILGPGLGMPELLFERGLPLSSRLESIRAMYHVYSDFAAPSKVEMVANCFDMWWDLLARDFWFQRRFYDRRKRAIETEVGDVSKLDRESRVTLEVMFETLNRILEVPDARTQMFALHGLGHLRHPDVKETVQRFIDDHKSKFTDEERKWIEECRDGTVM
jgi:hypothetical protein